MTVTADQLRDVMMEMSLLEKQINDIISPPLPFDRVVNFDPSVSAVFLAPSLEWQTPTWVNGGADFWCAGLGYTCWLTTDGGTKKLHDIGNGMADTSTSVIPNPQVFDFKWNMAKLNNRTGATASYLAAPGGGDSLLSRQALGNQETGRTLRFNPWKVANGDSLMFTIRPIGYEWSKAGAYRNQAMRVTVTMTMYGFTNQGGAANTGNGGTRR